ncbi:hypothetical protein CSOJ01_14599 [Colletotrichum sojae]|uniref:Secreted protein n=1 Tax=Colletotrichum sojae TaxID=2175907 RepID=A0A8H6MJY4_9PEZI|nr:hypothetical protein CSOJ01_14599 [Colletotrichum sojae]
MSMRAMILPWMSVFLKVPPPMVSGAPPRGAMATSVPAAADASSTAHPPETSAQDPDRDASRQENPTRDLHPILARRAFKLAY